MILTNLECIDCHKLVESIDYYNRYNKSEEQIRNSYRCAICQAKLQQKYRNRRY